MLLADSDTVGAAASTVTTTVPLALPPTPLQFSVNVRSAVSDDMVCEPLIALLPDQSPAAEHELALLLDQFRVVEPPLLTLVLLADSDTTGAGGGATDTLTE